MFLLPIGDEPNPPGRPLVNYALIGVNVAVFLLISLPLTHQGIDPRDPAFQEYLRLLGGDANLRQALQYVSAYDLFVFKHGFRPGAWSWLDLFSSLFLHGGWLHLIANMLTLWIFGDNVEHKVGRVPYLLLYLGTGVAATLFYAMFASNSQNPLVGASGAISGVLGCYFLWFPRNLVKMVFFLFIFPVHAIRLPARWWLAFYLIVDNLLPFFFSSDVGSGVAHGAHIGGFLGGFAVAWVISRWGRPRLGEAEPQPAFSWPSNRGSSRSGAPGLKDALAERDWRNALRLYVDMSASEREALSAQEAIGLADHLADAGHYETAITVLQRFLAANPTAGEPELARTHLRLGLVHLYGLGHTTAAAQHFLTVLDFDPPADIATVAREALVHIQQVRGDESPYH